MTVHQAIASPGCGCVRQNILHSVISIDEALALIAADATPVVRTEAVGLDRIVGRMFAQPVRSRAVVPSCDTAAMDGYAVATSTLTEPGPRVLRVIARVPAAQETTTSVLGSVAASLRGHRSPAARMLS